MAKSGGVNSIIRIPTSLSGKFFRIWVEFLTPIHNLAGRQKDVLAAFLKNRFELSTSVNDESLIESLLMSDNIKEKVKEECGISDAYYQVLMGKLRKANAIVNGKINPKFIPKNVKKDDTSFQLLLYFDLDEKNS